MALYSMTGFARNEGAHEGTRWTWEIRSLNGRNLDVRVRLPHGFEALEGPAREACGKHLRRGHCNLTLTVQGDEHAHHLVLNEVALRHAMSMAERASEITGLAQPDLASLLAIRGVLDVNETTTQSQTCDARNAAILAGLAEALQNVKTARRQEGARLASVLHSLIADVATTVAAIATSPVRAPEAVTARLHAKIERLAGSVEEFDPARLHQEVVLLATKADIEEEIARLKSHITAATELLDSDTAVGRKLEFLTQEFNREANTICSKSSDEETTANGLALKTTIDQIREQVQNIE